VSDVAGIEVLEPDAGQEREDIRVAVRRAGVEPGQCRRTHVLLAGDFKLVNRQVVRRLVAHQSS